MMNKKGYIKQDEEDSECPWAEDLECPWVRTSTMQDFISRSKTEITETSSSQASTHVIGNHAYGNSSLDSITPDKKKQQVDTLDLGEKFKNLGDGKTSRSFGSDGPPTGLLFGISKPLLWLGVSLLLSTTGTTGFFLRKSLLIPKFKEHIHNLEGNIVQLTKEVDRLTLELDRLETQNSRYELLNQELSATVIDLDSMNIELNETSTQLENVNTELQETNENFQSKIVTLTEENEEYVKLNENLTITTNELTDEVARFQQAITELVLENAELANLSNDLANLTNSLSSLTEDQNITIAALNASLIEIHSENGRLEALNDDLTTITSFLNETSVGIDNSFDQISHFLADQIDANRALVLQSLENTYRQRTANWDCDYRDIFREYDFGNNFRESIPAGPDGLDQVIDYVDDRVLSELCLDVTDFRHFIVQRYTETGITSNRLLTGVLLYTTEALDYYFPEPGETGLSTNEWADANYDCDNLVNRYEY